MLKKKLKEKSSVAELLLLIASIMWGGSYATQNIMSEYIGNYSIVFFKTFGGIILLIYALIRKKKFSKEAVIGGVLIGVTNGVGLIFQQFGITLSNVSKVSFISGLYILFVPIIRLIEGKKPKNKFWYAVLIACVGLYLLCMNGAFSIQIGDVLVLIAALTFAIQIILIDKYSPLCDPVSLCAVQQTTMAVMSLIMALFTEDINVTNLSKMIVPILYVIIFPGLIAQLIQNKYQGFIDPTVASLIMSLESVFGAIGGVLILGQALSIREMTDCGLIFLAITIAD